MIELELLGPHTDGSQLVFTDKDGERYLIVVDDALKAAVRRSEIKLESMPKQGSQLRPREIQQLLRAGMAPAEIASTYDIDLDRINRFEPPVIAERNFVVSRALSSPVGTESDSPQLGDLVIDRLATRGVDAQSLTWTALREDEKPWELHLTFIQAAKEHHASWQVSNRGSLIRALDEEGRWLTETTAPAPANVAQFPNAAEHSPNVPGEPASGEDIEKLLDGLAAQRGKRVPVDYSDEADSQSSSDAEDASKPSLLRFPSRGKSKQNVPEPPKPHTPSESKGGPDGEPGDSGAPTDSGSAKSEGGKPSDDGPVLPGFENVEKNSAKEEPKQNPRRSKRRSVPSWDEIVFGTRGD
ncbi:MAG: septation protein SepH [Actinomycetaceae bacterium]|nr:septation protein SepH [Actinomycetaceae bacterium]